MTTIALVGIDLGKRSFHIHAQDWHGNEVLHKQLNRMQLVRWLANLPPCTVAFESCCGAHWLGWKLREFGHTPRMIDPRRVRPFVTGIRRSLPCKYRALQILACSPRCTASIRFLYVRPALCLQLPSDSQSPATPLPFG